MVLKAVAECEVVDVLNIWLSVEDAVLIGTEVMWSLKKKINSHYERQKDVTFYNQIIITRPRAAVLAQR